MAKTTKAAKAPKLNVTMTIPSFTINAKTLILLAKHDRYELEEVIGNDRYLPTPEAMLQNPAYMEHLQGAIVKLFTGALSDVYEDSGSLSSKKIKSIFKAEIAQAIADKKKVDDERQAVLNGDGANTTMLKVSDHDAERLKAFLNRNDMPFIQMAQASAAK